MSHDQLTAPDYGGRGVQCSVLYRFYRAPGECVALRVRRDRDRGSVYRVLRLLAVLSSMWPDTVLFTSLDVRERDEGRVTSLPPIFYRIRESLPPGLTNQRERSCSTAFCRPRLTWCRAGVLGHRSFDPRGWREVAPRPGRWERLDRGRPAATRTGRERGAWRPDMGGRAGAVEARALDAGCSAGGTGYQH